MKRCTRCQIDQDDVEFYASRTTGRRRAWCRTCVKAYVREWQRENPDVFRRTQRRSVLKRQYGLTEDDFSRLLEAQGGVCLLCEKAPEAGKSLHVDHCHGGGQVRGLLCHQCNTALGYFQDSPELLRRAAEYLKASRQSR